MYLQRRNVCIVGKGTYIPLYQTQVLLKVIAQSGCEHFLRNEEGQDWHLESHGGCIVDLQMAITVS